MIVNYIQIAKKNLISVKIIKKTLYITLIKQHYFQLTNFIKLIMLIF